MRRRQRQQHRQQMASTFAPAKCRFINVAPLTCENPHGDAGMAVAVSFQVPKKWDLERKPGSILVNDQTLMACDVDPDKCTQGDLTIKPKGGADGAFLVVRGTADSLEAMTPDFIKKSVFNRGGKFGAFGAPEDVKFVKDKIENGVRLIDVKFNAFSPGGTTIARKGILAVSKAGPEAYIWVATTSATRWKNSEETLRNIAGSFSAKSTGQKAKVEAKFDGVKKSMFNKENEERARLERERAAEGIQ